MSAIPTDPAPTAPVIIIIRCYFFSPEIEAKSRVEHRNAPVFPQTFAVLAQNMDLTANEGAVIWQPPAILVMRRA